MRNMLNSRSRKESCTDQSARVAETTYHGLFDSLWIAQFYGLLNANINRAAALMAIALWLVSQPIAAVLATTPENKLVLTGTVTSIFQIDAPVPLVRHWSVTIRVEKVRVGKYEKPEFTFAIHSPARAGLQIGHRYTIEATWDGHEYIVKETVMMKEEAANL